MRISIALCLALLSKLHLEKGVAYASRSSTSIGIGRRSENFLNSDEIPALNESVNNAGWTTPKKILMASSETYPSTGWVTQRNNDIIKICDLKPGDNVLDLAAGIGTFAIAAKKRVGEDGTVVAVEISESMMLRAEREAFQEGKHILFMRRDINNLKRMLSRLKTKFDCITCTNAFSFHVKNRRSSLKLWSRYLKPGGRIVLDFYAGEPDPGIEAAKQAAAALGYTVDQKEFDSAKKVLSVIDGTGLVAFLAETLSYRVGNGVRTLPASLMRQQMYFDQHLNHVKNGQLEALARSLLKQLYNERVNDKGQFDDTISFWTLVIQRPG